MEAKNRTILLILIATVIAVAVFSSFGMNLIPPQTATLASPLPASSSRPHTPPPDQGSVPVPVEVTPDTVQSVIASLSRPEEYYREITVTYAGAATPTVSQVWSSGGWTRTDTARPNGVIQHTLIGEGTIYYWYGGSTAWRSAPADEKSPDLDGPHIPTYEDVLSLDKASITEAGYVERGGVPCLYVAWSGGVPEERQIYYISVETGSLGLLAEAQLCRGEQVLLSMTAVSAQQANWPDGVFLLPDGSAPSDLVSQDRAEGATPE